jgi:hypothetical protein
VREYWHYFFNVMGYEDHRGGAASARETGEELEEVLAGDWIESGARLVKDE